jgi:hypothetical protein
MYSPRSRCKPNMPIEEAFLAIGAEKNPFSAELL